MIEGVPERWIKLIPIKNGHFISAFKNWCVPIFKMVDFFNFLGKMKLLNKLITLNKNRRQLWLQ